MISELRKSTEDRMKKSLDSLRSDLAKGPYRPGAYGSAGSHPGRLLRFHDAAESQVANVTLIDSRTIGVQPWEKKMVPIVEKVDS